MFEKFIATRYSKSKEGWNFINIISRLSLIGVTIGIAALIIVISVFNGFGSLVVKNLVEFNPHIRLTKINENTETKYSDISEFLDNISEVDSYFPFLQNRVVLFNRNKFEFVNLKGVGLSENSNVKGISDKIISGKLDLTEGENKIIVGLPIALKLGARVGDTIQVVSTRSIQNSAVVNSIPASKKFILSGIFEINNMEYATKLSFTSLKSARETFKSKSDFYGIDIKLKDFDNAANIKNTMGPKFKELGLRTESWFDLNKSLFEVMLIERWAAYILLSLIIMVSTFNILASLTMSVITKRKDISVLRSMGATRKSIKRIFLIQGFRIGVLGTIAGLIIGLAVCYAQIYFNIYSLDPTKYIIDTLPLEVRLSDILIITLTTFFLITISSIIPANKSANNEIAESIRWE